VLREHPEQLGNLHGIPVEARDDANRTVMQQDLDRVQRAAGENRVSPDAVVANPQRYGLTPTDITRYNNAQRVKEGLDYNAEIGPDGKAKNEVFLHTYQPEEFGGQGRAAIAIGNPD
jgi:hypothetical protein